MVTPIKPRLDDIPRIAFVTRRFHELKGLRTATFGAGLLLGCLLQQLTTAGGRYRANPFQVLVVANMMYGLSMRELDRRYRETFGDPVASRGWKSDAVLAGFWGVVLTAAVMVDMFLQANRRGPSIVALTLASYSLFVVVRDGSLRLHYLIVVAAGLASALVTAAVAPSMTVEWYESDPARGQVFLLAYSLMGLGLVAAGLFDHYLLTSSLRPAAAGGDRTAAERHGASLTTAAIAAVFCLAAGGSLWKFSPVAVGLAFPLVLIIAGALSQIVMAIRDINRWARKVKTEDAARGRPMNLDSQTLVLMFGVALAAALDGALSSSRTPAALAVAIGALSAWVAVRDWPDRKHYLIGAFAAVTVFFTIPRELPARGFAVLVFAATGALAVEALIDYWKARHADTI